MTLMQVSFHEPRQKDESPAPGEVCEAFRTAGFGGGRWPSRLMSGQRMDGKILVRSPEFK